MKRIRMLLFHSLVASFVVAAAKGNVCSPLSVWLVPSNYCL